MNVSHLCDLLDFCVCWLTAKDSQWELEEQAREFLLSPLLTVLFVPFLFVSHHYHRINNWHPWRRRSMRGRWAERQASGRHEDIFHFCFPTCMTRECCCRCHQGLAVEFIKFQKFSFMKFNAQVLAKPFLVSSDTFIHITSFGNFNGTHTHSDREERLQ